MESSIETPVEIILMAILQGELFLPLQYDVKIDSNDQRLRHSLLRLIGEEHEETRVRAIKAYTQLYGQKSTELMKVLLFDKSRSVVEEACYAGFWRPYFNEHQKPDTSILAQALRCATTDTLDGIFMMLEDLPAEHLPLDALRELLEHENPSIRLDSALLLAKRREPKCVPVLLHALAKKDEDKRWGVIDALGECGDRSVVEEIWKDFNEEPKYWDAAARALFRLGELSVDDLLRIKQERIPAGPEYYYDSDSYQLLDGLDDEEILHTLLELSTRDSLPYDHSYFLRDITSYEDPRVLDFCLKHCIRLQEGCCPETEIDYLEKCSDPRVINVFLQAARSDGFNAFAVNQVLDGFEYLINRHLGNRRKAIPTLHEQQGSSMRDALLEGSDRIELLEFLKRRFLNFEDGLAGDFLGGRLGLLRMLILLEYHDAEFFLDALKDDDEDIRFVAACYLARNGRREGVDILLSILSDASDDVFIRGFWTLARNLIQAGRLVFPDDLCPLLSSEVDSTRLAAVIVLGHINDETSTDLLVEAAADPSPWIRALVAMYLAEKDGTAPIQALCSLLNDESEYPRYRAVEAIGKCGDLSYLPYIIPLMAGESIHVREVAHRVMTGLVADCQTEWKP